MPPFWSLPPKEEGARSRACCGSGPARPTKKSRPCRDGMLPWCHPASSACGGPLCGAGQSGAWAGNGGLPAQPSGAGPRSVCGSRVHSAPRQRRALTLPRLSVAPLGAYSSRSLPCAIECTEWKEGCQHRGRGGTGRGLRRGWSGPPRTGLRVCTPARPSQRGRPVASAPRGGPRGAVVVLPTGLGGELERRLIDTTGGGLL